jgi:hypothetical protein
MVLCTSGKTLRQMRGPVTPLFIIGVINVTATT